MKLSVHKIKNENGAALILSLLILMVLAIMSIVAVTSTNTGLSASATYKNYQQTLYIADGGADYGYAIIERTIGNAMEIDPAVDTVHIIDSLNLVNEINASLVANVDSADPDFFDGTPNPNYAPDANITIAGQSVDLDIDFIRSMRMPGTASEFASRYEGIGAGGAGGIGLIYQVESNYNRDAKSESTVRINYRCVEGGGRCL
jgi:hypothetical protein